VTNAVTKVKVGGGEISVSSSNESLPGAARDNNIISRQAAITHNHAPHMVATFRPHSPDGSSSYFAGCSQDGGSPRQSRVVAGGRGFAASRGTTSRYIDDDDDNDDDSDQSEFYRVKLHPRHLTNGHSAIRRSSASSRHRGQQPSRQSEWRTKLANQQRRRAKPRAKAPRSRVVAAAAVHSGEGYASDTPAAVCGDPTVRCSGYSSDSIDPTSVLRRPVVSTAAQTTRNDATEEHDGTGSGKGRLMSDAVRRYLEAAAAWDERHGCSTCSSSSSDSSSEFDYYLDRPLSTSGLGWSSSPLNAPKCSSAVKQCVVS